MTKILVTGATGFIGSYVVTELIKKKYQVIVTSRNLDLAKNKSWFSQVKYIPYDLNKRSNDNLYKFFLEPDIVIHLAWEGLPKYKNKNHLKRNLPANYNFLLNLLQNGLTNLTVAGTCLEYGMKTGCLKEEDDAKPIIAYAIAKDKLRKKLITLQKKYQFSLKWLRLFYIYGDGQHENSLLSQLKKAINNKDEYFNLSGGEQKRDFIAVNKAADYIIKIALQKKESGIINCCSGKPVKIKDFVDSYIKQQRKTIKLNFGKLPYNDYEPMSFWGDTEKLSKIIE